MKMLKTVTLGALALATVGAMNAETIKFTGSTAFRKATFAATIDYLNGAANTTPVYAAYVASAGSATAIGGTNQVTFTNGTDTVQFCVAGSVGGVEWVTTQVDVRTGLTANDVAARAWIARPANYATAWSTVSYSGTTPATATITGGTYLGTNSGAPAATWEAASAAQACMSDSFQGSTPFDAATTGVDMADNQVGVVSFILAKGLKGATVPQASYDRFTNMTGLQFQALASNGTASLALITGNSADTGVTVALIGRDTDSGTRLVTFAETAFGPVTAFATQYRAFSSGNVDCGLTTGTIDHLTSAGDGLAGYPSGGQLKKVLQSTNAITAPTILVGYAGIADTPGAAQQLNWAGVPYSDAAVLLGNYSFWAYQHMYTLPAGVANPYNSYVMPQSKVDLANAIAVKMADTAVMSGTKLADMQCVRYGVEGTVISPNY